MSYSVSVPQTCLAYTVPSTADADEHTRVLRGLWLGLRLNKIAELTGVPRRTIETVRDRARRELGKAGIAAPSWLLPPTVDKVR